MDLGNRLPQFLTGHTAHVPGLPIQDLWEAGGAGVLMSKAETTASKHQSQIARFYIGPLTAAYIRKPEHIAKLYRERNPTNPHEKPANGDNSGIYPYLFGQSILTYLETDPRYKSERKFYVENLMGLHRLDDACDNMSHIMEAQLKKQSPTTITNIYELRQYINRTVLTMVAQTQLGIMDLSDHEKDQLTNMVETVLPQIANLKNVIYFKMEEKLGCRPRMPLDKIRNDGYKFLQRLLDRNKEHILREPENKHSEIFLRKFLRKIAEEEKISLEDALKNHSKRFAAIVLFAGYESTSTSAFFNLMLLADPNHHELFKQVKDDISQNWNGSKPLTRENLKNMLVLDSAVREGLRLYPPFPTFKDILPADTMLDNVLLKKGTAIFISPLRAHRTNRDNNTDNASDYQLNRKLSETDPNYKLMTFGFEPRICPGRNLAMLENKVVLAYLVAEFDFQLQNLHHPFDIKEVYSLQLADSVKQQNEAISFKRRKIMTLRINTDVEESIPKQLNIPRHRQ